MKKALLLASCLLALSACQEKKTEAKPAKVVTPVAAKVAPPANIDATCEYAFVYPQTKLTWTAYKLTEKVGVSGSFDKITVENYKTSNGFEGVLGQASFSIPVSSINSGLPARDAKLVSIFFGNMKATDDIKGQVLSMKDGKAAIKITLNGVEKEVAFTYARSGKHGQTLKLEGVLDLGAFAATGAMTSLNEACKGAHTGKDGITKMWPDVKLVVDAEFGINCPGPKAPAAPEAHGDHGHDHGHSHDH